MSNLTRLQRMAAGGSLWLGLLLSSSPAWAATQQRVVFGEERFVRGAANPTVHQRTFTVPQRVSSQLLLHIINGHADPTDTAGRVEAGSVWIDGIRVVAPNDFGKHIPLIDKALSLAAGAHNLEIRLAGTPGSSMRLTLSYSVALPDLVVGRTGHTATLLSNGRVLFAGGRGSVGVSGAAEVFDPVALTAKALSSGLNVPRLEHTATLLPQAQTLLVAGHDQTQPVTIAELFSPSLEGFGLLAATSQIARSGHTATLLSDGRALILGGTDGSGSVLAATETFDPNPDPLGAGLYDPQTGVFSVLPYALAIPRTNHTATLLPTGQILVVGGETGGSPLASAELVDPAGWHSTLITGALSTAREQHTATLLPDGRVLVAAGRNGSSLLASLEVYAPSLGTFSTSPQALQVPRANHTATLLPGSQILIAGGDGASGILAHTELVAAVAADDLAPEVAATLPVGGAVDVDLNGIVSIRFSEPVDPLTVIAATVRVSSGLETASGIVSIGESGLLAFFVPQAPLAPGTTYTVTLSGVRDLAGNPLATRSFTFTTVFAPTITGFAPAHGPVGTEVVVTGDHFDPIAENNHVAIGHVAAPVAAATATSLAIAVPAASSVGAARITVQTRGGFAETATDFLVENPVPTLASIDPEEVPAGSGNTTLTLIGTSFLPASQASLAGAPLVTNYTSSTELHAQIPASALTTAGTFLVRVSNPDPGGGASNALALTVRVTNAVRSVSVTPASAYVPAGATQGFSATATLADGTSADVTASAAWLSTNPSVAGVVSGLATASSAGTAGITASFGGALGTAELKVFSPGPLPPDPALVAPSVNRTVATTVAASTAFLYSGSHPLQTGVAPGTIDPVRAALVRGRVTTRDGAALPGVQVTILGHPELGATLSRADGFFDLVVNGGGVLTVACRKGGFPAVQRPVNVPWQDFTVLPDVVMVPFDARVTLVDLTAATPIQIAQGSPVSDDAGVRRATLLFQQGTSATVVMPDGSTQPITGLHVRATELTVGSSGPSAMPAPLPPTSGYTYAVELSVDEAEAAGAKRVQFSQPVASYTENYLNFPVGTPVPTGFYDRDRAIWVASDNGLVVKLLDGAGLDVDGSGNAASLAALAALGIAPAEQQALAGLFAAGQSLWRVPVTHFTVWDHNWPFGPPPDAVPPESDVKTGDDLDDPCQLYNSIVECQNQTLGERASITGTPFTLNYRSSRAPGRTSDNTVNVKLSGASVPASLKRIEMDTQIAGKTYHQVFSPAANATTTITWDGKNAYGQALQGAQHASVAVTYVYNGAYNRPDSSRRSFGLSGGTAITGDRAAREISLTRRHSALVGPWDAQAQTLGGWSLDVQHAYDVNAKTLYLGDGSRRSASAIGLVIRTAAGTGSYDSSGSSGDGGPATAARLGFPTGLAAAPDGSLYIADVHFHARVIRRVDPQGRISTVAGGGTSLGDGGPAIAAKLTSPWGLSLGPEGSLYVADPDANRVRRISPDGIITTIAGTGVGGFSGDGDLATSATLRGPFGVAVGPDGSVYIADNTNRRVRKVSPDGIITTVAGTGLSGSGGDGGPAVDAQLRNPVSVAVGSDGSVYVGDFLSHNVRKIAPDGVIQTVAGNGNSGFSGDGGPATSASLGYPYGLAVGSDNTLYLTDTFNGRIRRVGPDGVINTVVGNGDFSSSAIQGGDGKLAAAAAIGDAYGLALAPDGALYLSDATFPRVRRVASALPGVSASSSLVPSEDGSEVYVFDASGRHMQTLNALTGAALYNLAYDAAGRLLSVADGDGNLTTVERSDDAPTAIVAPGGQRTTLTTDGNGYLSSIADPTGRTIRLGHGSDGLLATFTDPKGNPHPMTFDPQGRLLKDETPAGGFFSLARAQSATGHTETVTSALGRVRTYELENLSTGAQRRVTTDPSGLRDTLLIGTDGSRTFRAPDGTVSSLTKAPDPRWGIQVPTLSSVVTLPSGLKSVVTSTRSATLADPQNPLSLQSMTDTVALNGKVFKSVFDPALRKVTTTTAAGRSSVALLDALGRVVQYQRPGFLPLQISYDSKGRVTGATQGNRATSVGYDAHNRPTVITDALGRSVAFAYDAAGYVTTQTLPGDRTVGFTYDLNGNLTSLTPPGRPAHRFTYTPTDLTAGYTSPDVGTGPATTTYDYNADKQPTQITRADGRVVAFEYDGGGRLSTTLTPQGQTTRTYQPSSGQLASITTPTGVTLSFNHDGPLLTSTTWTGPVGGSVTRTFDNNFRAVSESVSGGNTIGFGYDADGLLTQAGALTITRDPANGVTTGTRLGIVSDAITYNSFGEPTSFRALSGTTEISNLQLVRDALGRITQKTDTADGITRVFGYDYDPAGRLSAVSRNGAVIAAYTYDANGNRLTASGEAGFFTGSYDARDRLLSYGAATYTYTAAGELQTKTEGGRTTSYEFDALSNLTAVVLPDGTRVEYVLDGQNRRIGKRVNGVLVQRWLYGDSLRLAAELDDTGAVKTRFVYGDKLAVPEYMVRAGTQYRIVTDHLGSPRFVVNASTGAVAQRLEYDEWGNISLDTNPGFQPFGFTGREWDAETGLYYFRARYYDPKVGRFISEDPIGFDAGVNFYGYVANQPTTLIDPLGLFTTGVHNSILQSALGSTLTPSQIRILQDASAYVDRFQDPAQAFMHGMANRTEDPTSAAQRTHDFAEKMLDLAVRTANEDSALHLLGQGMHALADELSPSHGSRGWWGTEYKTGVVEGLGHILNDRWAPKSVRDEAARRLRDYYDRYRRARACR